MKNKAGFITLAPSMIIALIQVAILIGVGAFLFATFYGGLQTPEQKARATAVELADTVSNLDPKIIPSNCEIVSVDLTEGYGLRTDRETQQIFVYKDGTPTDFKVGYKINTYLANAELICALNGLQLDIPTTECIDDLWINPKGTQSIVQDYCVCYNSWYSELNKDARIGVFPKVTGPCIARLRSLGRLRSGAKNVFG